MITQKKSKSYESFSSNNGVGFILPLGVDFDICLGESKNCFGITDSPSIDGEKHTCGDSSAIEWRHVVSRDYVRRRTFSCVFRIM